MATVRKTPVATSDGRTVTITLTEIHNYPLHLFAEIELERSEAESDAARPIEVDQDVLSVISGCADEPDSDDAVYMGLWELGFVGGCETMADNDNSDWQVDIIVNPTTAWQ